MTNILTWPNVQSSMTLVTIPNTTCSTVSMIKMKDECAGIPIIEYVGLHPKMYFILKKNNSQI